MKSELILNNNSNWISFEHILLEPLRNGLFRPSSVRGSGIKMVNMGEIFRYNILDDIRMEKVPLNEDERSKSLLKKYDLLFARSSLVFSGTGKCVIFVGTEDTTFESHIIRARLNQKIADPKFYYYFFNSKVGRKIMESITEQTAASGIRSSDLVILKVPKLSLDSQKKISDILWLLDMKIRSIREINYILEDIIRSIFKSWFVNFDGQTEFDDSELGQIPKGWKITTISDVCESIDYGYTQSSSNCPVGPKFLRITDIVGEQIDWSQVPFCEIGENQFKKYKIYDGDIVIARTGATTGANKIVIDPPIAVFASYLVRLKIKKDIGARFVATFLLSNEYRNYINSVLGDKSAQPNANAKTLTACSIVIPEQKILHKFTNFANKVDIMIRQNQKGIESLIKIRDSLLQKLMSGEIRV